VNALNQERIKTPRLALVPLEQSLAKAVLDGDLTHTRHADGWPHADTRDAFQMAVRPEKPWPVWLIVSDGTVIGDCGTAGPIDENGEVDIGLGLAEGQRGRGYGTEVIEALSRWLLDQPGVRRVVARDVLADNVASRRALERAGFILQHEDEALASYAFEPIAS